MPEAVVRLAALTDVADQIAGSLDQALDAAAPFLATELVGSRNLVTRAARASSRLASRPRLDVPVATYEDADWDRLAQRLSNRQRAALIALLGGTGR